MTNTNILSSIKNMLLFLQQEHPWTLLGGVFGDRNVTSGLWPTRSPDFMPCDLCLWGLLE